MPFEYTLAALCFLGAVAILFVQLIYVDFKTK